VLRYLQTFTEEAAEAGVLRYLQFLKSDDTGLTATPDTYLLPELIPATKGPKERSRKNTIAVVITSCPIKDSIIGYLLILTVHSYFTP